MHPALHHRYRLRSEQDVAIAERMIKAAHRVGWTDAELDELLSHYAAHVPALESGQLDANGLLHALWDFAASRGIGDAKRSALLEWKLELDGYIAAHAGELPPEAGPPAQEAAAELAELEEILRTDPDKYWASPTLQHLYHDAIERTRGQALPPPIATKDHIARVAELEAMMGSHDSPYWRGANAASLQAEYRNLLNMGAPAETPAIAAPSESTSNAAAAIVAPASTE